MEDFHELLHEKVNPKRMAFQWHDSDRDPKANYKVDCLINGMPKPLFVYALANDNKTRDATISLHQFKEWGLSFSSVGIVKDEKATSQKVLARFRDVCDECFIDIKKSDENIKQYMDNNISVPS